MVNPEFLSGEASASPAVELLIVAGDRLTAAGFSQGALSARNGPRTTTHAYTNLANMQPQDFVEIADYDPHLDRILCLGRRDPHPYAGMHHLMFRAKKEIGAIAMVERTRPGPAPAPGPRSQLDMAMAALEALRKGDIVPVGRHMLAVGRTVDEATSRAIAGPRA